MILVDTSVWIDFFRNNATPQAEWLDRHLAVERFAIGDLILTEVLQGFRDDHGFESARRLLSRLAPVAIGGFDIAAQAAQNYRLLRRLGVTVRGTVDVLIATRCLESRIRLLHSDRDFDAMERHLGLPVVRTAMP